MIGLTPQDQAVMRREAAAMLSQTGRVRRKTAGGWTTVVEAMPCLLTLHQGRETRRTSDAAAETDADVVLTTRVDADVAVGDRVTVDGRIMDVTYRHPRSVAVARWYGRLDDVGVTG